jgi:alkylation response protein AidB-like acyl-CoA dehydrogenase
MLGLPISAVVITFAAAPDQVTKGSGLRIESVFLSAAALVGHQNADRSQTGACRNTNRLTNPTYGERLGCGLAAERRSCRATAWPTKCDEPTRTPPSRRCRDERSTLTSGVQDILEAVRGVASGPIAADAARVDRERMFPTLGITALSEVSGLGIVVPADHGGSGGGLVALAEACEAVGAACASTGMVYLMHAVMSATIAAGGGDRMAEYLDGLACGRVLGTLAFSERGTGAHFYAPELEAIPSNGGVKISGRKSFVTSGGHADVYLVLVRSGNENGLDCFLVERGTAGVDFDGEWQGLGMAGNSSVAMEFTDVAIDASARIGAAGAGADLVFSGALSVPRVLLATSRSIRGDGDDYARDARAHRRRVEWHRDVVVALRSLSGSVPESCRAPDKIISPGLVRPSHRRAGDRRFEPRAARSRFRGDARFGGRWSALCRGALDRGLVPRRRECGLGDLAPASHSAGAAELREDHLPQDDRISLGNRPRLRVVNEATHKRLPGHVCGYGDASSRLGSCRRSPVRAYPRHDDTHRPRGKDCG